MRTLAGIWSRLCKQYYDRKQLVAHDLSIVGHGRFCVSYTNHICTMIISFRSRLYYTVKRPCRNFLRGYRIQQCPCVLFTHNIYRYACFNACCYFHADMTFNYGTKTFGFIYVGYSGIYIRHRSMTFTTR